MSSGGQGLINTWRYALIGGLGSIPLTLGLYWLSGMGNELSLNMVLVGGLVAGYLAKREDVDIGSVGLRAGVIGVLPGLWFLVDTAMAAVGVAEPIQVQAIAIALMVGVSVVILLVGGIAGIIGAKIGAWLATKNLLQQGRVSGQ